MDDHPGRPGRPVGLTRSGTLAVTLLYGDARVEHEHETAEALPVP